MTVSELSKVLECETVCGEEALDKEISGCYIGDLLSLAMSKVQKDNVWITIQSNINITAVASLTEAGCIIICEGFSPDENARIKAEREDIPILKSEKSAYELAKKLAESGI